MLLLLPRFPLLRDVYGVGLHRARLPARQVRDLSARSATIADHRFRGSPHPGASAPPTLRLPITDPVPTPPTGAPARCASSPAPPGPQPSRHALIIAGSTQSPLLDRETSALAPTTYLTISTLPRPHRYSPNNADRRVILPILFLALPSLSERRVPRRQRFGPAHFGPRALRRRACRGRRGPRGPRGRAAPISVHCAPRSNPVGASPCRVGGRGTAARRSVGRARRDPRCVGWVL